MTFPLEAFTRWLDAEAVGSGPVTEVSPVGGGTQNVLVSFRRDGRRYVLRRPPVRPRPSSDDAMRREARVLAALRGTAVPHPALVASCPDPAVLGQAFLVTEWVDGANLTAGLPEGLSSPAAQHALGLAVVDALATVASVDPGAVGLADLGRPEGWLERQVPRWRGQLEGHPTAPPPGIHELADWLDGHRPPACSIGLVHGDFHVGNLLVDAEAPRVAAVLDWELATLGDPLLDLGHLLATWPGGGAAGIAVPGAAALPRQEELIERYAAAGRRVDDLGWFRVLASFRLAVLLDGTYARSRAGLAPVEVGQRLRARAEALVADAHDLIGAVR